MRFLKTWLVIGILALAPVLGQADVVDDTVRALQADGFSTIRIGRTWLGRTRIEADGPGVTREIILNPRTGEILRDWQNRGDADQDDRSRSVGAPRDADDDDESAADGDEADDSDNDAGDDHSNSGSGSGGQGADDDDDDDDDDSGDDDSEDDDDDDDDDD